MRSKSNNIKFTSSNNANEVLDELFELLSWRYQKNLETSVEESDFLVDSVQSTYYKCHKVNLKRGGPSIDSPEWLKKINRLSNNRSKKIKMINVM